MRIAAPKGSISHRPAAAGVLMQKKRDHDHDVARGGGVSPQTVSRVINKRLNVMPVQARVWAAIDKLGYVPSLAARRSRARAPI